MFYAVVTIKTYEDAAKSILRYSAEISKSILITWEDVAHHRW